MSKRFGIISIMVVTVITLLIYMYNATASVETVQKEFPMELLPKEAMKVITGKEPSTIDSGSDQEEFLKIKIKGEFYTKRLTSQTLATITDDIKKTKMLHYAYTIWCEGKGEGSLGMAYVGSVIRNRLEYNGFSDNLLEVLHDPADFSCWGKDGKTQILTVNKEFVRFLQALELAIGFYDGYIKPVTTASHYHAVTVKPRWASQITMVDRYKNHIFYLEESRR